MDDADTDASNIAEAARTLGISEEADGAAHMVAQTPLGRLGKPADIGPAAVFLASDAAAWISGESIRVAGGFRG